MRGPSSQPTIWIPTGPSSRRTPPSARSNPGKGCPIFAGVTKRLHWPFPDPSAFTGTYEERLEQTREIRDQIRERIETWCDEMCAVEA